MTFTPHISIYTSSDLQNSWFGDTLARAILIFAKNLDYNKKLARTRVNIFLGDEEGVFTHGSIKIVRIKNTVDTSLEVSDVDKIAVVLKIIYHSLMAIAAIEGWETATYEKAYQQSVADNGNFVWYSPFKTNRNRSLKARIKMTLDKDGKVPIIAEFFDNKLDTHLFEILIINTFLHFVDWERVFEKPIWIDNEKFGFSFLKSQLMIFADTHSKKSETIIIEKTWTREEIEGRLRSLTFIKFENRKEFIDWISK